MGNDYSWGRGSCLRGGSWQSQSENEYYLESNLFLYLAQIIEVLKNRNFPEIKMELFCCFLWCFCSRYVCVFTWEAAHERWTHTSWKPRQGAGLGQLHLLILILSYCQQDCFLTAVGTKNEGVKTAFMPQMVKHRDVGVHVVDVVGVGRVLAVCPLVRGLQGIGQGSQWCEVQRIILVEEVNGLRNVLPQHRCQTLHSLALTRHPHCRSQWHTAAKDKGDIFTLKPDLEEAVQIRMRCWVDCGLKERLEEVLDDVLEAWDLVVQLVDVIQAGHLDQPQCIVRINLTCFLWDRSAFNAKNQPYWRRPN